MTITPTQPLSIREIQRACGEVTAALHRSGGTRQAQHLERLVIQANLHGADPEPVLVELRAYEPSLELVRTALAGTPVELKFTAGRLHPLRITRPGGEVHTWPLRAPALGFLMSPRASAILTAQQVRMALRSQLLDPAA